MRMKVKTIKERHGDEIVIKPDVSNLGFKVSEVTVKSYSEDDQYAEVEIERDVETEIEQLKQELENLKQILIKKNIITLKEISGEVIK